MPFYDYKCSNPECNHIEVDVWEKPSDDKFPHVCPVCEDFAMLRQIGNIVAVNFKNLPKGHNLSATERRRLFNSNDPKEFKQIM